MLDKRKMISQLESLTILSFDIHKCLKENDDAIPHSTYCRIRDYTDAIINRISKLQGEIYAELNKEEE